MFAFTVRARSSHFLNESVESFVFIPPGRMSEFLWRSECYFKRSEDALVSCQSLLRLYAQIRTCSLITCRKKYSTWAIRNGMQRKFCFFSFAIRRIQFCVQCLEPERKERNQALSMIMSRDVYGPNEIRCVQLSVHKIGAGCVLICELSCFLSNFSYKFDFCTWICPFNFC